jgi:CDP-glucose 4,6-dehydratase
MDQKVTYDLTVFRGKRVLVTGDTGFKGSWLCLWLKQLGAEVTGLALPPERNDDHFNLIGLSDLITHVTGDIRDLSTVLKVFQETRPEFVFHLAAQPIVRRSYDEPKLTFDTNVGGSVNILEAVRATSSVRTLVYVTSDKCYKNREWLWGYRENDELGGRDPYSASKAAAELVFSSYCDSFFRTRAGFGAASVRAGNVIGGGDWAPDRIVPDCIRSLREGRPVIRRNPLATRPWQHVLDPLAGYLQVAAALHADPLRFSEAWNFGPTDDAIWTVEQLTGKIITFWGKGELQIATAANAPHEATLLHLNCDKSRQKLGWRPRWDVNRAVAETVIWYKAVVDGRPPREISLQQIKAFTEVSHD